MTETCASFLKLDWLDRFVHREIRRYFSSAAFFLAHIALAALAAIWLRCSGGIFSIRAFALFLPPLRPIAAMKREISLRVGVASNLVVSVVSFISLLASWIGSVFGFMLNRFGMSQV